MSATNPSPDNLIKGQHETAADGGHGSPILFGPNGLRAGWRIGIFLLIFFGVSACMFAVPAIRHLYLSLQTKGEMSPGGLMASEAVDLISLFVALGAMMFIEKRSFADYGLPLNQAFGKLFWLGLPLGFVALSALLGLIAALKGFSLGGLAVSGSVALKFGLIYGLGFFLTGIFEELSFRGYLQATLASATGFWPAALILAICFGAVHLGNRGEAIFGALMAGCFGLVAALALRRTGNLWLGIAMHAAWDWGETFFYSVPDSGMPARGHLLNSAFHGPNWLTGGTVGPEGSWLVFPVLVLWALAIHWIFPARRATS